MERKWQLIIFFIAMIILSAGGYGYIISESTAQTSIENLTNSSRIVETSNNITYYQITDENNIIGFENETYIAINNNNPSNIIIIGSYDLDLLKQITPTIKNK